MQNNKYSGQEGFTLIELLIVIAILAILATVAFVGIDPLARFADTRNAKRSTDTNQILSAIKLHQVDNKGNFLSTIQARYPSDGTFDGKAFMIGTGADGTPPKACVEDIVNTVMQNDYLDLTELSTGMGLNINGELAKISNGGYLSSVPMDVQNGGNASNTGYYIIKNENKSITIGACTPEQGTRSTNDAITATR